MGFDHAFNYKKVKVRKVISYHKLHHPNILFLRVANILFLRVANILFLRVANILFPRVANILFLRVANICICTLTFYIKKKKIGGKNMLLKKNLLYSVHC